MNDIQHPNIMHLHEFLESKKNYYLVIDYCNKGDLEKYLNGQPNKLLSEKEAVYFLKQIMNGFQVLHKKKVMHRDFKLANIFLNEDTLVIGDFGFAKSGHEMTQTVLGTPITMAPEVHLGEASDSDPGILYLQSRLMVHWNGLLPSSLWRIPLLWT
jgi:serine/threonine protein kinase